MELSPLFLPALLLILIPDVFTHRTAAQANSTNTTLFSCSSDTSPVPPCATFVLYRTQPGYTDLAHISDLFGTSSQIIQEANGLPSESITFLPGQLIAIPINCGCTGNRSFANVTYWIASGDNFYLVSTRQFENLTDYLTVEALNPGAKPNELKPGQAVLVPLFCKCHDEAMAERGINYLMTYTWAAGDDLSKLSKELNSSAEEIRAANNNRDFSAAVYKPILVPVAEKPRLAVLFYNATSSSDGGRRGKFHKKDIILSSMISAASAVVICTLLVLACCKVSPNKIVARTTSNLEGVRELLSPRKLAPSKNQALSPRAKGNKVLAGVSQFIEKPAMFDFKSIMEATMNLSSAYWIEGSVYQATLNGEVYAIKRAKGIDVAEELNIFQMVNHTNLIKMAGFAVHEDGVCFLVYEFAENGSLDKWLFAKASSSDSVSCLSWRQRLNIALDVASGLQYLHEHTRPSIVHGGIKSSNVMLDAHYKAKISNFSKAKPATVGLRPSADVFDFGVLLMELLSGRRDCVEEREAGGTMWREMRAVLGVEEKGERLRRWMDPKLKGLYPADGAVTVAGMARACTREDPAERSRISEIVFGLTVLAQSCSDAFDRAWAASSEETMAITDVVAR
ncbi:serine/threonine receptor-like kinase NFP [Zingiber officinale]|nr:serine/threonine receptor-like kinase NFP [Zingiber officinale]